MSQGMADGRYEGYRVVVRPCPGHVRVVLNGEEIASSRHVLTMSETRLADVFYFPAEDVHDEYLKHSDLVTNCPFKGNATYWSLQVRDTQRVNAAWGYKDAFEESQIVQGHLAFDWHAVDQWFLDDVEIKRQPHRSEDELANPFVDWLLQEAWKSTSIPALITGIAETLQRHGLPLSDLEMFVRTLNPQLYGLFFKWSATTGKVVSSQATHKGVQTDAYLSSPYAPIINGEGGVRRRLEGQGALLDYPILEELSAAGSTDYVALPLRFSDGQINILSLVSDAAGGFSTTHLGFLYEILPHLARLIEAHAQRMSSLSLLQTYLGKRTGQRVLNGSVKRGDGEDLDAIIWFSDLRNSTRMADTLPRESYLAALDEYFDCVAGAIISEGGEVLKFIGDGVLAVFPISSQDNAFPQACSHALAAVKRAHENMATVNKERLKQHQPELAFGTGLHRGNITYGNIGTNHRLDFTVIGPAVNEASRIEGLCKALDEPVLFSALFAAGLDGGVLSLGVHELAGVTARQEIFKPAHL
jgi:adenylate cyclase